MKSRIALVALVALCGFSLLGAYAIETRVKLSLGEAAAIGKVGSTTTVNKFGRNQDSDTTEDAIYEGSDLGGPIRCFADIGTTAVALYAFSDDEADAAKVVTVEAIDANWDVSLIDVTLGADTLSGGTAAAQVGTKTLLSVNRAFAKSTALVGNIYINADNVDDGDGVPTNVATKLVTGIVIGENQTLQACYTVPSGFNALMTQYCTSVINTAANATALLRIRKSVEGAASRVQEIHEQAESTYQCTQHEPPIKFSEKTDIELTSVGSGNNGAVSGTFDLILMPNTM